MPSQIEVIVSNDQLEPVLERYRDSTQQIDEVTLCTLGGGVLQFIDSVFPEADRDLLLIQKFQREPDGHGPHFDLYNDYLNEEFPWIATLNLTSEANIRSTVLPEDLANAYLMRYPEPNREAFDARRVISRFALDAPEADVWVGYLDVGTSLLLPQHRGGPHIVHEVVPAVSGDPGEFIKAFVADKDSVEFLNSEGYKPLDAFFTELVGGVWPLPVAAPSRPVVDFEAWDDHGADEHPLLD